MDILTNKRCEDNHCRCEDPNGRVTERASRPINSAKAHHAQDICEEISTNQYSVFTLFLFWKVGVPMYVFKRFDSTRVVPESRRLFK